MSLELPQISDYGLHPLYLLRTYFGSLQQLKSTFGTCSCAIKTMSLFRLLKVSTSQLAWWSNQNTKAPCVWIFCENRSLFRCFFPFSLLRITVQILKMETLWLWVFFPHSYFVDWFSCFLYSGWRIPFVRISKPHCPPLIRGEVGATIPQMGSCVEGVGGCV